jgi:hypothetical protein
MVTVGGKRPRAVACNLSTTSVYLMAPAWQITLQQSLPNFRCVYAEMRSAQARLRTLARSGKPQIAELACLVLEVAVVTPLSAAPDPHPGATGSRRSETDGGGGTDPLAGDNLNAPFRNSLFLSCSKLLGVVSNSHDPLPDDMSTCVPRPE